MLHVAQLNDSTLRKYATSDQALLAMLVRTSGVVPRSLTNTVSATMSAYDRVFPLTWTSRPETPVHTSVNSKCYTQVDAHLGPELKATAEETVKATPCLAS